MKAGFIDFVGGLLPQPAPVSKTRPLAEQLEEARREWLNALNYYNDVSDADLVDYAAYMIQASEKKYSYLLKLARQEGLQ